MPVKQSVDGACLGNVDERPPGIDPVIYSVFGPAGRRFEEEIGES